MHGRRDRKVEEELQSTLDNGANVWVIGHSTMPGFGLKQSEIWESEVELLNSRPAAIGIDSCCYGDDEPQLTAFNLLTGDVVKQRVIHS